MTSMSTRMVRAADGDDGDLLSFGDEESCKEELMRLRFPGGSPERRRWRMGWKGLLSQSMTPVVLSHSRRLHIW